MLRRKKKLMTAITSFIACLVIMVMANTNEALAFGGEYTITDPKTGTNYTKEAPTQITTSYDSSGNLIVTGFSFFTNTQQYLSKGTGSSNTHYYRLKIEGTDFVYNDSLVGGDNYSEKAMDGSYQLAPTSETLYCVANKIINTSGTVRNAQLQQVSFKFVVPASDLKTLAAGAEYRLILEHNLTNVRFQSTGSSAKYKFTFNITKLIDANLSSNTSISKDVTTSSGVNTVAVSSIKNFEAVRVNGSAVSLRNSSGSIVSKTGTYNDGYWVKRPSNISATELNTQKNVLRGIAGSVVKYGDYLGEYLIPMNCTYASTSTSITEISLDQLFASNSSLKTEYNKNVAAIANYNKEINEINKKAKECVNFRHYGYDTQTLPQANAAILSIIAPQTCSVCLNNYGYNQKIALRDSCVARNAQIEAMCYTKSSSTSNITKTYYCKSIYVEAPKDKDYWTSLKITQKTANIKVISRTQKEKVNDTALEGIKEVKTTTTTLNISSLASGQTILHKSDGIVLPKGYHVESVVDDYTDVKATYSASKPLTLPNNRSILVKGSLPAGQVIYVDYVFRNNAPTINKK